MPYKDLEKRKAYHAEYIKKWDAKNKDKRRESTKRSMQKWRDENPERAAIKMRNWRSENKEKSIAHVNQYKKSNPEKAKAHSIVKKAIRKKELMRMPCEVCGNIKSQAHHENYNRPLDVNWLCQKHHSERHKSKTK